MADFSTLIATLQATIKTNYRQEITGQILQDDLLAIVDAVNRLKQDTLEGYAFHGAPLANGASVSVTQNTFFLVAEGEYEINGSTIEVDAAGVSVIVYDSVNNTTNWYTLFAYDTTPTENSRNAITSGAVAAALAPLATKEDVEAVEQEVAQIAGEAGLAEAVIDTDNAGTEQEFTFRKSGGDGGAYYRKIKGKTIAWNQGIEDWNFSRPELWSFSGGTLVINSNKATFTKDSSESSAVISISYPFLASHNYLPAARVRASASILLRLSIAGGSGAGWDYQQNIPANQWVDMRGLISNAVGGYSGLYIVTNDMTDGQTLEVEFVNITDLTLAGMPNITASEFLALYPGYHEYTPGTLISNDAEAVETTGVNQWDEEWEAGRYDSLDGSKTASTGHFRCKNLVPVFPSTVYYFKAPGPIWVLAYDKNGNYLELLDSANANSTFTTPANCGFLTFYVLGTSYSNNICINISNPAINGQYFPYWKRTLQLGLTTRKDTDGNVPFADGMKGAGTAADWADKVGGEMVMKRVDLGSLEWSYNGSVFVARMSSIPGISTSLLRTLICSKYAFSEALASASVPDKAIANNNWFEAADVLIKDSAYSDAETFKAAMQGVMLDYPLATPVPFTWAEPLNLGVKVDENGTERAVAPEGATAPSAPFVADTTYTMSVARMVEKLRNL